VSLTKIREGIYRSYYHQCIHKINSTSKKYKEIRISERIQENDLLHKANTVRSMVRRGEYQFRIFTENSSEKCKSALLRICELLQTRAGLTKESHEIKAKNKRKPPVTIERYMVSLDFSQYSKVDYEKVNRKWRRHLINLKLK
jgi:hypothetical protein